MDYAGTDGSEKICVAVSNELGRVRRTVMAEPSLELYSHPLASFCWKVLIALYEIGVPFTNRTVDLADPAQRRELLGLSPFGKLPALRDNARASAVFESTLIIEHLARHYGGGALAIDEPAVRRWDRIFDLYVQDPMQRIVFERLRGAGSEDAATVTAAKQTLKTAYALMERELSRIWAAGDHFTLADCAAMPALFYADQVEPIDADHPHTRAYVERLLGRPSAARVLKDAEPYFQFFPGGIRR